MDKDILSKLEKDELRCVRCALIVPFGFKRGGDYTIPSFTLVEGEGPVCYRCYHPKEFAAAPLRSQKK